MTTKDQPLSKNPTNPLVLIRELHNLSQDDLANSAGITIQIVANTEIGIFNHIPPSILDALEFDFGVDRSQLDAEYGIWVREQLEKVNVFAITSVSRTSAIEQPDIVKVSIPVGIFTFREWRRALLEDNGIADSTSLAGFGKLIKVQPVTIRKYEDGRTKSLPQPLVDRLEFWGFPQEYLSELAGLPIGRRLSSERPSSDKVKF